MKRGNKLSRAGTKQKILITLAIGVILILGLYATTFLISRITGFFIFSSEDKERDFITCLKEQEIFLYIKTSKDGGNVAQIIKNIQLGDYLEYIDKIIDCRENELGCLEKGIDSFPTWIIENNKIYKDISFEELSMISGCELI